jgi:two-component system, chemotaxis family, CheB/CheR fusion protein
MEDKEKLLHDINKLTEKNRELRSIADKQQAANHILQSTNKEVVTKNDELEKINKELEAFTYVSSHDLQEPLRKIQIFADRIQEIEGDNLSEKGKQFFLLMQNAANRMQLLIEDLLAFSRLTITEREFENSDLSLFFNDVKIEFQEELKKKKATIEICDVCGADIIGFQFRQLMHNLISNAIKFSRADEPLRIEINSCLKNGNELKPDQLLPDKEYCHISVKDNGIGFEEEYSEKIFEVFQKLHDKEEYPGTGIGLATVKKIVDNHNGLITATSELNKGTTFDIYLPSKN